MCKFLLKFLRFAHLDTNTSVSSRTIYKNMVMSNVVRPEINSSKYFRFGIKISGFTHLGAH